MNRHLSNAPRWIAALSLAGLSLAGRGLLVGFAEEGTAGHQRAIERLLAEGERESAAAVMRVRAPSAHAHSGCEGVGVFLGRRVVLQCRLRYFAAGVSATRNTGAG